MKNGTEEKKNILDRSATKIIAYTALLAALVCVLSPFAVNIGPIPLSFGSLGVYIAASLLDFKRGTAAVLTFVLLGAFGVPVFTNFTGGFFKLIGPTGGFIFGYIPCALIIGLIIDKWENKAWIYPLAMIAGTTALYACGTLFYMLQAKVSFAVAFSACVAPFLIGDAIKIAAATALCFPLRKILKKFVSLPKKTKSAPQSEAQGANDALPKDNAE